MAIAYIAFGSNLGEPIENFREVLRRLSRVVTIRKRSEVYETKPYGELSQANFLNAVVSISTCFTPQELLSCLQRIEKKMGRVRKERWGPRTIDLDILLYEDKEVKEDYLQIPHVELTKRAFVLVPLNEVYMEPLLLGKEISEWIRETNDFENVWLAEESW
ncbi:MAG: 2-amino-4-hydroxy-6-hydroxymethyldihydropteridine diphosphokinase [Lactobacillales bacterium]|jgi:2-amino-4-hydroxy-6-hydroxymethyldihydropteridine diphosphokinase|nr:2-amino-4-hydroxy-6-hydroxymethyldihydropteridine diphosphokinase [Lactobacillales bacterium]